MPKSVPAEILQLFNRGRPVSLQGAKELAKQLATAATRHADQLHHAPRMLNIAELCARQSNLQGLNLQIAQAFEQAGVTLSEFDRVWGPRPDYSKLSTPGEITSAFNRSALTIARATKPAAAPPVSPKPATAAVASPQLPANAPATKLAVYRSLKGQARVDYLARHQGDIFRAQADESAMKQIIARNGTEPGPSSPIGRFLHLRSLSVGSARADYFAKHHREIEQGAKDFANAKSIAERNGINLQF